MDTLGTRAFTKVTAIVVLLGIAVLSTAAARAGPDNATAGNAECSGSTRGRLLSTTALIRLSKVEIAAELAAVGLPDRARYGIESYRLAYCTVSPSGTAMTASGLLALPQDRRGPLPLVLYAHSTVAKKTGAPSFLGETEGRVVPLFYATDGFAVAAPDYLGLGISPGRHPYLHAASEASASLDMVRAADMASRRHGVRLTRNVLVTGHSQGGHTTMAVGQAIQRTHSPWRLAALAPMAGPYDLSGAESAAVLDPDRTLPQHASFYLAYLFTAWKDLYHLYSDPRQVFTARYAGVVEGLFDGNHGIDEIDTALPAPEELFRPEVLTLIANPSGRYAAALRDNDVCHWAPRVPTRLYAARGDRDVVFANAEHCLRQIVAQGGTAQVVDMGDVDHVGTAITSLPLIRTWFTQLATG